MTWSLARPDWRERIVAGQSLIPDLPELDQARARQAIAVYDKLHLPDVPGQPLFAQAGGDWFREIVGALHGSLVPDAITGLRRRLIESVFCLVPKKNSKSTNAAALMLTSLLINQRPRAEFLLVGATQHIADIAFRQIEGMIEADDYLRRELLHVQAHIKKVTHRASKATLQVKSFDTKVLTGAKPAGALIDELHLLGEVADADRVIGQLRGGLISQPEGFLVFITTQSERPPAGVFAAELRKARAIRDGQATGTTLPVLYEFPEKYVQPVPIGVVPAWQNTALWPMVTPNRDRSITVTRLAADFEEAKLAGQAEIIRWASQHLNVEIGLALRSDAWAGAAHWEKNSDKTLTLERLLELCEVVVIGVDGGGLDDLLGLTVLGRERQPKADLSRRRWLHWGHAWAHPVVLERRKEIAPALADFEKDGDLTIVQSVGEDAIAVAEIIGRVHRSGLLPEKNAIGVDAYGIGGIVDEIKARGIDPSPEAGIVQGIAQGWKLNGAIKTVERKLAGHQFLHAGCRLMAWNAANAKVEVHGNAISITKQASGFAKIDLLMSLFDAATLMSMNPEAGGASHFERRGLIIV